MTINDLVKLTQSRLTNLNAQLVTATVEGDLDLLNVIESRILEAENTLNLLRGLEVGG